MSTPLLFVIIGFLSGSVPWSLLLGFLFLKKDIRTVGDGNPGAFNVMRAGGGGGLFVAAMLLDAFKAALPVAAATLLFGVGGWSLVPVALAPVLGHMFSPFLGYRGGKAVASTTGMWGGLTFFWEAPFVMGTLLGLFFFGLNNSGYAVVFMLIGWLVHLLVTGRTDPPLLTIWAINTALVAYKYHADLQQPLAFRNSYVQRVDRLLGRSKNES